MKRFSALAVLLVLLVSTSGCEEDFASINTNPNSPEEARAELLLPQVVFRAADQYAREAWYRGNLLAQLTAKINFTDFDRYLFTTNTDLWNTYYGTLRDAQNLYDLAVEQEHPNYQGVALLMKAWMFSVLTDCFGDIPYTEALEGKDTRELTPAYDRQEAIYAGILEDLAEANALLDPAGPALSGDLLYDGDVLQWKKLTNAIRLRLLLRVSNVRDVSAEMQQIVDGELLLESNDDNGALSYLASAPNQWFQHTGRVGGFDEYRMSRTIEQALEARNDPRQFVFFRDLDNPDSAGVYTGVPNGLSEGVAYDYNGGSQSNVSRLGTNYREEPDAVDAILMTYSELQFILAEAAFRGFITGDPEAYYLEGIRASMAYYDVEPDPGYYAQASVAYDPAQGLERILQQKWLSLFLTGYEAWFDWRRTGLPVLEPAVDNVNGDRIPVRFTYPEQEQSLNAENYRAAIAQQGPDDINTPVWWDQ